MRISSQRTEGAPKPLFRAAFAALVLAAAGLRLGGLFTDFWLDEIWGLAIALDAPSWADLLFRIHVDANHILNGLWMNALGERLWWPAYRLPSLAAGAASVAALGALARRDGPRPALCAAFLAGASHLLILYSSEARGYALLVLFSLGAFHWMRSCLERRPWAPLWMNLCVVLGFLAHLTFLQTYLGLASWSLVRALREEKTPREALRRWALLQAPSLGFLALFYWGQVRFMAHIGGPQTSPWQASIRAVTAFFGAPVSPLWALGLGLFFAGVTAAELGALHRKGSDEWAFHAAVVLAWPAALIALNPAGFLFPRYFQISLVFFLLLLSRFLVSSVLDRAGRAAFAAALLPPALGNGAQLLRFYRDGRGQYLAAVRHMAERSRGDAVTVGSEHEFAHRMMFEFYARYLPGAKRLVFYPRSQWTRAEPEWAVVHEGRHDVPPLPELAARNGSRYQYERTFRYSDHAGWNWFLYRLKER